MKIITFKVVMNVMTVLKRSFRKWTESGMDKNIQSLDVVCCNSTHRLILIGGWFIVEHIIRSILDRYVDTIKRLNLLNRLKWFIHN